MKLPRRPIARPCLTPGCGRKVVYYAYCDRCHEGFVRFEEAQRRDAEAVRPDRRRRAGRGTGTGE